MQFITRFANSWAAFRRGIGQILPSTVPHLLLRQAMFSAVPWFLRLQTNCCCITYTTRRGVARGVGLFILFTLYVPVLLKGCATWQRINRAWYLRYTNICKLLLLDLCIMMKLCSLIFRVDPLNGPGNELCCLMPRPHPLTRKRVWWPLSASLVVQSWFLNDYIFYDVGKSTQIKKMSLELDNYELKEKSLQSYILLPHHPVFR